MADLENIAASLRARAENSRLRETILREFADQMGRQAQALDRHADEITEHVPAPSIRSVDAIAAFIADDPSLSEAFLAMLDALEVDTPHAGDYEDALQDMRILLSKVPT